MMWLSTCLLVVSAVVTQTLANVCPESCICSTTRDGLHRAACSDLSQLYKFTLRQKHHNINILDLSHNNITKLNHELDRLTEVVTLDLSTNGIAELNKFLRNAKKLVHLNLANNRLRTLSLLHLPPSVSSLDLTHNLLSDVPSDYKHLKGLEHLQLEGNPLQCTCQNIIDRDHMLKANIFIDDVKCAGPFSLEGKSWLQLKTKDVCKQQYDMLDMMMGDQPDAAQVGEETSALKSMPLAANNDLEDGNVIHNTKPMDDDDSMAYIAVKKHNLSSPSDSFEGSGDLESTTYENIVDSSSDNILIQTEGSGSEDIFEGSGSGMFDEKEFAETTTPGALYTGPVVPFFTEDSSSEFVQPKPPTVYAGGPNWHIESETQEPGVGKGRSNQESTTPMTRDTTISEQIRITQASNLNELPSAAASHPTPHRTGTMVCIAIIVVLLVGLIGFAIVKAQIRKRRNRRMLRQQKRDIEKASKEMVHMNESLLGKPAVIDTPIDKKMNGKYELVPTHEPNHKKNGNGDLGNGFKHSDNNGIRHETPRDSLNKSILKDNDKDDIDSKPPVQETSFESSPDSQDFKKDTMSLSSDEIFMPLNDGNKNGLLKLNGFSDPDASQPLINGNGKPTTISDLLSPREYVPVYSPDMGMVRIKLSETPKPKTPVLVTRSRSNAGDIILTPTKEGNSLDSTT